jgi:hypothetical protein
MERGRTNKWSLEDAKMFIATKSIVAAAALLSVAVTAFDVTGAMISPSAADGLKDGSRWTDAFGAATAGPVATPTTSFAKGDRLLFDRSCSQQAWPYIAFECLMSIDGTPLRQTGRTVTSEIRTGDNTSILVRRPAGEASTH